MTTQDIDICCDFSTSNLLKLQTALEGTNPVHRMTTNRVQLRLTEENCRTLKTLYLDTDIGQLDCLGEILGIGSFPEVKKQSEAIELDEHPCHILSDRSTHRSQTSDGPPKRH